MSTMSTMSTESTGSSMLRSMLHVNIVGGHNWKWSAINIIFMFKELSEPTLWEELSTSFRTSPRGRLFIGALPLNAILKLKSPNGQTTFFKKSIIFTELGQRARAQSTRLCLKITSRMKPVCRGIRKRITLASRSIPYITNCQAGKEALADIADTTDPRFSKTKRARNELITSDHFVLFYIGATIFKFPYSPLIKTPGCIFPLKEIWVLEN